MFIAQYQAHDTARTFVGIANDENEAEAMLVEEHNRTNFCDEALTEYEEVEVAVREAGGTVSYQPIGSGMVALEY